MIHCDETYNGQAYHEIRKLKGSLKGQANYETVRSCLRAVDDFQPNGKRSVSDGNSHQDSLLTKNKAHS